MFVNDRGQRVAPLEIEPRESLQRSSRRFGPLRGGDEEGPAIGKCAGFCFAIIFLICAFSITSVGPNEYGISRSYLSGEIGYTVVRGGIHFVGPFSGYVKYPATQISLEWSRNSPDHVPITTRTGADPKDPESGGQPISITCALQFKFRESKLRDVYLAFATFDGAQQRFRLLAGNMVSNTAQEFTPQAFWQSRRVIATEMHKKLNQTLWHQGAVAVRFEMMKVEFAKSFEDSITQVQVAEQQRIVNGYEQQVQQVVQSIAVLQAENEATIANISASAEAEAKEIKAAAMRDAFHMKQEMKAKKYAELQDTLGFSSSNMQEYFKIKSVQGQAGKVVVGIPQVG